MALGPADRRRKDRLEEKLAARIDVGGIGRRMGAESSNVRVPLWRRREELWRESSRGFRIVDVGIDEVNGGELNIDTINGVCERTEAPPIDDTLEHALAKIALDDRISCALLFADDAPGDEGPNAAFAADLLGCDRAKIRWRAHRAVEHLRDDARRSGLDLHPGEVAAWLVGRDAADAALEEASDLDPRFIARVRRLHIPESTVAASATRALFWILGAGLLLGVNDGRHVLGAKPTGLAIEHRGVNSLAPNLRSIRLPHFSSMGRAAFSLFDRVETEGKEERRSEEATPRVELR